MSVSQRAIASRCRWLSDDDDVDDNESCELFLSFVIVRNRGGRRDVGPVWETRTRDLGIRYVPTYIVGPTVGRYYTLPTNSYSGR